MDTETALILMRPLADGINPITGEQLTEDHAFQQPQIVRALSVAVGCLEQVELQDKRRKRMPANSGLPWTEIDDEALAAGFDGGKTLAELASECQRTRGAIEARLVKLGKLESAQAARRWPEV